MGGLQTVPRSYYEAADIDGASPYKKFIHITIPLLAPTIFFVSITSLIQSFQMFDLIFLLIPRTGNGLSTTRTVIYEFYQNAFEYMDKGYASAISIAIFIVILIITSIQLKLQKKWVTYL
ncbi:sugar ABC transporter permease [Jeotgalibaca sp. MA1X17-3]|uniref:carbohydrate ABC transporter permease n=1 Tax=Jeotgalibaca sp. MA1X17-3 TaxID=2908211 RepID=UPI001F3B9929|nr:sugar ABC transporter permease [Jeotgalibaca sp. MA1X17-3]UJF15858.1 sugar ABC transporter permease [Jeotgalibaca sp. MA1X17-3]